MKITKSNIVEAAKAKGLKVIEDQGHITIKRRSALVNVYDNGDLIRGDVHADLATKMSAKTAAQVLKLA